MRTKTLLLTAAATFVSVAVMAQVVSVNVVGFVNKSLPAGFAILNNPLSATSSNMIDQVIPAASVVEGTEVYKFSTAQGTYTGFSAITFGDWSDKTLTMNPGEGFWINSPSAQNVTFVGEVKQGTLTTTIGGGFNLVGSQVPQQGKLSTDLAFTAVEGDNVYQYQNPPVAGQAWANANFLFGAWSPDDPAVGIGEGFFLFRDPAQPAQNWTRTFNVGP